MHKLKALPEFDTWFDNLKDHATRARLTRRLEKVERGRDIKHAKELAALLGNKDEPEKPDEQTHQVQ